jgi:glycosyltransferase involved in cell wall biosynthesis
MDQTYRDLDIVCLDDCSTDNTYQLLQKLASQDSRLKLYRNETNLGLVATLNKLVSISTTDLMVRMDPDDISPVDRIEKLFVAHLEGDYDIVSSDYSLIDEKGHPVKKRGLSLLTTPKGIAYTACFNSPIPHSPSLLKKQIFSYSNYDEKFKAAEDYRLWTVLFLKHNIKVKILPESLYEYRINSQGMSLSNAILQGENHVKIARNFTSKRLGIAVDHFAIWEISRGINFTFDSFSKIKRTFGEINRIRKEFIRQSQLTAEEQKEVDQYTAQYLTFTYLKAIRTNLSSPSQLVKVIGAVLASSIGNAALLLQLNNIKWLSKQI